jgi:ribose transport system substrate-binding protein
MNMSQLRHLTLSALILGVLLAGCGGRDVEPAGETGGATQPDSRGTIGFSALTLKNPFFKIIADNIEAAASERGFDVIVHDADRDVNTQSRHIDNFIARGVTAIVINPADRVAIGPAIRKANEAGIPVFTCDLQCVAEDVEIAGHVGTDNFQGGRLAGEAMIEALGESGGEVLILHFKQANSCVLRVEGFKEVVAEHNESTEAGRIELVAELDGGGLRDEGFRVTSDALQAHPNLSGIFAINDPSALGAWTALRQAGKEDQVTIIGFDGQIEGKQAIRDGKIYADPIQFPDQMGRQTVENIEKYLNGEPFDPVHLIPTELYTRNRRPKRPGPELTADVDQVSPDAVWSGSFHNVPAIGANGTSAIVMRCMTYGTDGRR